MLGLFFLRSTGILRSQKNEEIRKTEVVILKKNKIWKLPDNIRSTVSMSSFFVVTDYSFILTTAGIIVYAFWSFMYSKNLV